MVTSFAMGRFSVSTTKQTTDVKQVDRDKDTRTQTVVTTVKSPDGTVKTVETRDTTTSIKTEIKQVNTTAVKSPPKLNISALVGNDFSQRSIVPLYGISIQKEVLGPVTVGAFGLTNGTIGISLGLDF